METLEKAKLKILSSDLLLRFKSKISNFRQIFLQSTFLRYISYPEQGFQVVLSKAEFVAECFYHEFTRCFTSTRTTTFLLKGRILSEENDRNFGLNQISGHLIFNGLSGKIFP